jgi:hypothetical protein
MVKIWIGFLPYATSPTIASILVCTGCERACDRFHVLCSEKQLIMIPACSAQGLSREEGICHTYVILNGSHYSEKEFERACCLCCIRSVSCALFRRVGCMKLHMSGVANIECCTNRMKIICAVCWEYLESECCIRQKTSMTPKCNFYLSQGHSSFITHLDWSTDSQYIQSNSGDYELLFCKLRQYYLKY